MPRYFRSEPVVRDSERLTPEPMRSRTVRVLATSLAEFEGAQRLDCGDGPLWIVETEELSEEEARPSTDPAPSTQ